MSFAIGRGRQTSTTRRTRQTHPCLLKIGERPLFSCRETCSESPPAAPFLHVLGLEDQFDTDLLSKIKQNPHSKFLYSRKDLRVERSTIPAILLSVWEIVPGFRAQYLNGDSWPGIGGHEAKPPCSTYASPSLSPVSLQCPRA